MSESLAISLALKWKILRFFSHTLRLNLDIKVLIQFSEELHCIISTYSISSGVIIRI